MAKTIKKEFKIKNKKNNFVEQIVDEEVEPILVNEKNEIIYDAEGELEKITSVEYNYDLELDDDIKEGLDFIKKGIDIPAEISNNPQETAIFIEKKLEELTELTNKLNKQTEIKTTLPFTNFWNGMTF
jgi:hypothetical protein